MLLLEDKNDLIEKYTLDGYTLEQIKASVWKPNNNWILSYIEVDQSIRRRGLATRLISKIIKKHKNLIFQNHNPSFWKKLANNNKLDFVVILQDGWGEIKGVSE